MRPLYEITAELAQLNDLLDDVEGDLSRLGEMEPAVTAWLDAIAGEEAAKLDGYIHWIRQLQMEAAAARAEEEQWTAKRKARESRAKYLELKLLRHLEATGQLKVTTATGRVVSVVRNGGVQPVEIKAGMTVADVPADFHKVTVEFDRAAVRAALDAGAELAWAELLPRGVSLRVK